ncbi:hypothetical protein PHET_11007 [Paragonimus heterotremus]|uniref:Uncharacterized protein n=1 Tax=Paragonimus heterotremus TaxID=100268 RepID=A0A8J4SJL5_9TREM|nr:hypothetical protein PHET_11007 [Paragonimus heterotremus]
MVSFTLSSLLPLLPPKVSTVGHEIHHYDMRSWILQLGCSHSLPVPVGSPSNPRCYFPLSRTPCFLHFATDITQPHARILLSRCTLLRVRQGSHVIGLTYTFYAHPLTLLPRIWAPIFCVLKPCCLHTHRVRLYSDRYI